MATHYSIVAEITPWTEEPGGLQPWNHTELDTRVTNLENLKRRVRNEESPVLQYLANAGWSTEPLWIGQEPSKVPATAIFQGMGCRISMNAIAREMTAMSVKRERGTEIRYYLYRKD